METKQDNRFQSKCIRGAGLVEYSLLVALIAVISIGAVDRFGRNLRNVFYDVEEQVGMAAVGPG